MNQLNLKKMEKNLKERWQGKTPKFWKRVQRWAIIAGTIAGTIVAAPIALPTTVVAVAGYITTAGVVAATLSQLTIENKQDEIINQ
jgi:Na+/proline symporter